MATGEPSQQKKPARQEARAADICRHGMLGCCFVLILGCVLSVVRGALHQEAYLKPSTIWPNAEFGGSVAVDNLGVTAVVGARQAPLGGGGIYIFTRDRFQWAQQAEYHKVSVVFGHYVAISGSGDTIVASAYEYNSPGQSDVGAVYVYVRNGTSWSQQALLQAPNRDALDEFGSSLALSNDGMTLAVGAFQEDSSGLPSDNSASNR